jgi:FSR family fosmidomycin resistance protein-like MFS transporter
MLFDLIIRNNLFNACFFGPRLAIHFSNIGHFFNHVIMLVFPTVALTLSDAWGVSYGEMLSGFFIGSMVYGFAAYPAGWLGDRWSDWGMMVVYFIGTGVAAIATGFSQNLDHLILGLAFIGLFASIYHPVGTALVVRLAVNRAHDLGRNGAWGTSGLALSALLSAALTYLLGWRSAFFIPGIFCCVLGVAFIVMTRPIPRSKKIVLKPLGTDVRTVLIPQFLRVLSIMSLTVLAVGIFTQAFTTGLPNLYDKTLKSFVDLLDLETDLSRTVTASFVSLVILFGALGQIIGGRLSARYSPKFVYVGMFLFILPLTFLSLVLDGPALIIVGAIMMLAITGCLPAENCILVHFAPETWLSRLFSLKFVLGLGGGSVALLANGFIFDQSHGFSWFFLFLGFLALVVVLGGLFLPKILVHEG